MSSGKETYAVLDKPYLVQDGKSIPVRFGKNKPIKMRSFIKEED